LDQEKNQGIYLYLYRDLAEKINYLVENEELPKDLGKQALEDSKKYTYLERVKKFMNYFQDKIPKREGEYALRGDYHRHLDPTWSYYPFYKYKMEWVFKFLKKQNFSLDSKILDAGCGEGVLIEKLIEMGYKNAVGIDADYESKYVKKGNILKTDFQNNSFDLIFLLDVLEHLNFLEQEKALEELKRIIKPQGKIVLSIPNLAHLESRVSFLFGGSLKRTANIKKHPGDRPLKEYKSLILEDFKILKIKGIFVTFPYWRKFPWGKYYFLFKLHSCFSIPSLSFLNIFIIHKKL
jgi:2-polyprenyl-3-methyl-5-hydroxy-6-metoxy-1,4-benzoquinol methylase